MPLRHHHRTTRHISFNATPLFDLMFTLTIFFMLVCQLSSAELLPMEIPQPEGSQARITRLSDCVVLNCRWDAAGGRALYSLGPNAPEPLEVLSDRLAALKVQQGELKAVIRADRRLPYADVRAAMRLVAENKIRLLNVAAQIGEGD